MVSTPSPPAPPDPMKTAQAQGQMNKETAVAQAGLNSTNQVTPYGNLTYSNIGTWSDGTPRFQATTTLSPEQQNLFNLQMKTQGNLGQIGVDQSAKVANILNTPFDLNSAINNQQANISTSLLDPVWNQRQEALRTQLANQGITQGSEAYTNALRDFGMQRDNAYNSALLADRGQATQEALTQRNQPLNEITALLGGSQVQQPNFTNTPSESIAPPDYQGAVYNSANLAQQNYKQQAANNNAMLGGMFGLLSAPLGGLGMFSDRRLKTDISAVGKLENGLTVYSYRYKAGGPYQIGLMADEVEKIHPEAVHTVNGFKAVNYAAAVEA